MPQGDYVELFQKRYGKRFDAERRARKKLARAPHERAEMVHKIHGLRAKLYSEQRRLEKIQLRKTIAAHEESTRRSRDPGAVTEGAVPAYLMDREGENRAKVLSNMVKQKRKERAGKWDVPISKVAPISEETMFRVVKTGKSKSKSWKRMVTQPTFVGQGFTRKNPKYERFIRPSALRIRKAHVTHPELKTTFCLPILGVKKNPSSDLYTELGVLSKGTIIEVDVQELGLVTQGGKVIWGKYAQITNDPSVDGCVNAVLLV